jgi:hypothetical protein
MKMIWHNAIRKHPHRNPLTRQANQLDKDSVITVLMKYLGLRTTPIDDMITDTSYRGSGRAWHTAIYLGQDSSGKKKKNVPFNSLNTFYPSRRSCRDYL